MDHLDIVIDRLHTDASFRASYTTNPDAALSAAGLSLSADERQALEAASQTDKGGAAPGFC